MTTIQTVMNEAGIIRNQPTKQDKSNYLKGLSPEVTQLLGGHINKTGIGPEIFSEIKVGTTNVTLEQLIQKFDTASKVSSSIEKRTILSTITLTQKEKDFIGRSLYSINGNLNLGIKIPRSGSGITDTISVMLAANKPFDLESSIIEEKFDGHRCLARRIDDKIILQSRNSKPMTVERVSSGLMDILPNNTIVDGEIVAADGQFQSLKIHGNDVGYQIFDCLYLEGNNIMDRPLTYRREKLESIDLLNNHPINISDILDFNNMEDLDRWIEETGSEGVMAKDPYGIYAPGKRDWIKHKLTRDINAQIVGMMEGNGKRKGTLGALQVIPEGLSEITKVGTGFSDSELDMITGKINRNEKLNCVIKYQNITKDGKLRFPVFARLI